MPPTASRIQLFQPEDPKQFGQGNFSPVGLLKLLDLRVGQRVQAAEIGVELVEVES
jgi:hypothetical protein